MVDRYPPFQTLIFSIHLLPFSQGKARDGLSYGPLTDKPDWSYAGTVQLFYKNK